VALRQHAVARALYEIKIIQKHARSTVALKFDIACLHEEGGNYEKAIHVNQFCLVHFVDYARSSINE